MKIAISSDWHGNLPKKESRKQIEESNLLLLAGDVFGNTLRWEFNIVDPVSKYLIELRNKGIKVVMTPGNHDFHLYNGWILENPEKAKTILKNVSGRERISGLSDAAPYETDYVEEFLGAKVLIDDLLEIDGLRIYGTPWTPEFCCWAFMLDEPDLETVFKDIPENLDILVSHGPPLFGSLDMVEGYPDRHCGSIALRDAILEKSPRYCFCGHIHTGDHNENLLGKTVCQNVSLLDEEYNVRYPVRILEI